MPTCGAMARWVEPLYDYQANQQALGNLPNELNRYQASVMRACSEAAYGPCMNSCGAGPCKLYVAARERERGREMTAEDLGLAKPSYAFWLGAEG